MRGRFISLLLILAVLFGSAIAPAIAHAKGEDVVHASEVLDVHDADAPPDDDRQKPASGMPGETASHHHCTVGLTATAPEVCLLAGARQTTIRPAATRLLTSFAHAPPTQPPSA